MHRCNSNSRATVASQVAAGSPAGLEPLQAASEKIAAPAMCGLCKLASGFSENSSVLQEGLVVHFLDMRYLRTDHDPISSVARVLGI